MRVPYLCIVAEDRRQFTFSIGLPAVKLIQAQAQEIEESGKTTFELLIHGRTIAGKPPIDLYNSISCCGA